MIKILSVKTRRAGTTREAFRRHYEERHVPLGLGFLDRFRWRRYVRNHVVAVRAGEVDFDCLTEFWVRDRADQESTRAFALEPAFRVLDEDDARFLDVGRRFSCELEERPLAGAPGAGDPPGTRRLMALFSRPPSSEPSEFLADVEGAVRDGAWPALAAASRSAIDVRVGDGARPGAFAVLVSAWARPEEALPPFEWRRDLVPAAVVELDVVETPPSALFGSD